MRRCRAERQGAARPTRPLTKRRGGGRRRTSDTHRWARILIAGLALSGVGAHGQADRARAAIERAIALIDNGEYRLARSYLQLPLIDARIHSTERSRAYYLQGYSLAQQGLYVGAALDYAKALAFNPDNPATLAALGYLTLTGTGVERDAGAALALLRRGAELGHPPAQAALGTALLRERGDLLEARRWLQQAIDGGELPALLGMAESYRDPHPNPEPERARALYQEAARAGIAEAYTRLGHMALGGEMGEPDRDAAALAAERWFRLGADAGDSGSALMLGYLLGIAPHDAAGAEAERWLLVAHRAGERKAAGLLAYLAERSGDGQAARRWRERAADSGDTDALETLSRQAFAAGDAGAGIQLLRRAVDGGAIGASNRLAWHLATHSDPGLRDGVAAVRYAQLAITHRRSANSLDTLAAAYASSGRFADAVGAQTQALAQLQEGSELEPEFRTRLQSYETGRPWLTTMPEGQP
ncbi:MAG: hypothetical protein AAF515_07320 [Pseudomonadota bacterium]